MTGPAVVCPSTVAGQEHNDATKHVVLTVERLRTAVRFRPPPPMREIPAIAGWDFFARILVPAGAPDPPPCDRPRSRLAGQGRGLRVRQDMVRTSEWRHRRSNEVCRERRESFQNRTHRHSREQPGQASAAGSGACQPQERQRVPARRGRDGGHAYTGRSSPVRIERGHQRVTPATNCCKRCASARASASNRLQSSGGWPLSSILRNTR